MAEVTEQAWCMLNRTTQDGDFQAAITMWLSEQKLLHKIAVFPKLKCSFKNYFHLCEELGNFGHLYLCLSLSPVPVSSAFCSSHWYFNLFWRTEKGISGRFAHKCLSKHRNIVIFTNQSQRSRGKISICLLFISFLQFCSTLSLL